MGAEQSTAAPGVPAEQERPVSSSPNAVDNEEGQRHPRALVICGPSGVGKNALIRRLLSNTRNFGFSVSHTTRKPRPDEQEGVHYRFVTRELFAKEVDEDMFLEHAEVHGNLYGTSKASVQEVIDSGRVCVLDIDVQGARQARKNGLDGLFVFVAPPSLEELERRLIGRGTEDRAQRELRLSAARGEINSLNEKGLFDYLLINDNLEETYQQLERIANRALAGLPAELGHVPEQVVLEDELPPSAHVEGLGSHGAASSPLSHPHPDPSQPQPARTGFSNAVGLPTSSIPTSNTTEGMNRWLGKVALVTGASSGIGWAVCEALARSGLRVVAVARRRERLEQLQQHMMKIGVMPGSFLPVVCDITKEKEVQALPKILAKRWPENGIDVLVNNAGLSRNDASLFSGNTTSWLEMISTNVLGLCMCTREVVQDMKRRDCYGHIINMVGLSGHRIPDGPQGGGFYAGTKFAVRAITEGLRQEARGAGVPLRVSGISPGLVETEFFQVRSFGDPGATKRATSQIKCLEPQDVARAVLWCLSAPPHMEVNDIVVRPSEQMV